MEGQSLIDQRSIEPVLARALNFIGGWAAVFRQLKPSITDAAKKDD